MTEVDQGRSAERLVVFTDAVVAIVITLLALPLVDIATALSGVSDGRLPTLALLLREHGFQLVGFVISFFVIARLWWSHHRIFEHVVRWSIPLVVLNMVWLFAIVLLPVATAITTAYPPTTHPEVVGLYIGVMVVANLLLSGLALLVHRHPELTDGQDTGSLRRLIGSVESTIGFLLALIIGTVFVEVVNYWAFLLLSLTGRLDRPIERRLIRRAERRAR